MGSQLNKYRISGMKSVNAIEVIIQNDGSYLFNFSLIKQQDYIDCEIAANHINITLIDLLGHLDRKFPLAIVIHGKGVLTKKVVYSDKDKLDGLLHKVLPNAREKDFGVQITEVDGGFAFVSVIRISVLDEILRLFADNDLTDISLCYIGPLVIKEAIPLFSFSNQKTLEVNNYKLLIEDQNLVELLITDSNKEGFITHKNRNEVHSNAFILYSLSHLFFNSLKGGVINSEYLNSIKDDFIEKEKFKKRGWILLISSFVVLLVNFLLFSSFWQKNNDLQSKLGFNKSSFNRIDSLRNEITQKKLILGKNGRLGSSFTSFYSDCLAESLPNSITWTKLEIFPIKKRNNSDEDELIEFENGLILISGNCIESVDLNDWMKQIRSFEWIKEVELLSYKQESSKERGLFMLQITMK